MATGLDTFGETIRHWLEEPDNDEAEPVSSPSSERRLRVLTRPRPTAKWPATPTPAFLLQRAMATHG